MLISDEARLLQSHAYAGLVCFFVYLFSERRRAFTVIECMIRLLAEVAFRTILAVFLLLFFVSALDLFDRKIEYQRCG
jgi:hypothetical protein